MTAALSQATPQKDGGSALRWLFGLLMNVEETARSGIIELRTADDGFAGQVAVSHGRVCFVIPPGQVLDNDPLPPEEYEGDQGLSMRDILDGAREAQAQGRRLGDILLERPGLLASRSLLKREIALNLHTVAAACVGGPPIARRLGARDDYEPRLTFSALDIFLESATVSERAPAGDIAERIFEEYQGTADAALLFTRPQGAGMAMPLAARGLEELSLATAVKLGRAVMRLAAPFALPFAGDPARLMMFQDRDAVWVCAVSDHRLALIRTCTEFGAGQVLGFATALVRRSTPPRTLD